MDRQKNTGLKLDQKIFFRFNFSFKKRKEAEIFLLSLGRNTHGKKGTKVTLAAFCANVLEQGLSHMKEAAVKAASVEQGMESISESLFTVTHY